MDFSSYREMPGVRARNALSSERDLAVLRRLAEEDPRQIVRTKALARLRVLAEVAQEAESPDLFMAAPEEPLEALEPRAEKAPAPPAPEDEPAPPAPEAPDEVMPLADGEEPSEDEIAALEIDSGAATPSVPVPLPRGMDLTPVVWTCTKCGEEGPPERFGWRVSGGRRCRQPQCKSCRREASVAAARRKREAKKLGVPFEDRRRKKAPGLAAPAEAQSGLQAPAPSAPVEVAGD